jgi:hypothetical protein
MSTKPAFAPSNLNVYRISDGISADLPASSINAPT